MNTITTQIEVNLSQAATAQQPFRIETVAELTAIQLAMVGGGRNAVTLE